VSSINGSLPAEAEVRAALERILSSPGFADAGRLGPFLRFLVETTLSGDGTVLKESLLGVEVFGRPATYDPRTDPIVRVEARRLRSRLADYYEGPGRGEAVRVDLPKGTYVPVFRSSTPAPGAQQPPKVRAPYRAWAHWYFIAPTLMGLLAIYFVPRFWRPVLPKVPPAVAVLPFANVSADPQNEYFSDGLTEELIDTIGQLNGLRVIGRGASFQYKGKEIDSREVGKQLNVSHVLEGSVRRSGDQIRVSAQLVNTADGFTVWSQTYDRPAKDVFAIQQEIAGAIANALKLQLSVLRGPAQVRSTASLEAYNLYLKGRYQWNRYSEEGLKNAVEDFEQAIDADPGYAPSYAMLSSVYALMGYYRIGPVAETWSKAKAAAERAISIDNSLAEAHASLGFVLALQEHRWKEAEAQLRKAVELNPASGEARGAYAISVLLPQGRFDEANTQFAKALELDPAAVFVNYAYAFSLLSSGRVDDAVKQYARTLELNSTTSDMWWDYGMALAYAGRKPEAIEAFRKSAEIRHIDRWEPGSMENALLGNVAVAEKQMEAWAKRENRDDRPTNAVRAYATLGNKDKALEWLGRAFDQGDPQVVWMKVDRRTRSLRGDPRFEAYMKRIGL
jgi:TolB-like protein/Flp pilus assembly protein TadD